MFSVRPPVIHSALSNIQIIERELTSGKVSVLLFISLKYCAWAQFSLMFYVEDFF